MGVYKALLLAGCAGTIALATPAMAQAPVDCVANPSDPTCTPAPAAAEGGTDRGHRLAHRAPGLQLEQPDGHRRRGAAREHLERGARSEPQQAAAVHSGADPDRGRRHPADRDQHPGRGDGLAARPRHQPQPRAASTAGAARRATPRAWSTSARIPSAAIERVEVITGGASATYGADAIAGVTNFILKKNFQGLELDGRASISQEGDGFEYQLSGIMGTDFDDGRGNISLALSMNTREASLQSDRDHFVDSTPTRRSAATSSSSSIRASCSTAPTCRATRRFRR